MISPSCRTLVLSALLALSPSSARAEVLLPGTQPGEGGIELAKVAQCAMCHGGTKNGVADPLFSWQGGMMAQAARDPVFRAALAIANQDVKAVGEYCIRCHAPRGWLEGRSKSADGALLTAEDMHGVSCEVCHHLVDPKSPEAPRFARKVPPGYGNGMIVVDPANAVRGPYPPTTGAMPHAMIQSSYQASSELCANCHNVSNPLQASDVNTQPPHAYGHIERTYSEWALSDFAKKESLKTCQDCHFPTVTGGGQASKFGSPQRDHFVRHGAVGGSTWVQAAVAALWEGDRMVSREALDNGVRRGREMLRSAASLTLDAAEKTARIRVTNLTGHKLPSGYPEGRRMWLNVRFLAASGALLAEVGRYGDKEDTLSGKKVTAPTLLDPDATRVYECKPGISPAQAKKLKKKPGASFHFVLNDVTTHDNRIPPRGYRKAAFAEHLAAPVGAEYADGQHWDDVEVSVPAGTAKVEARLMYQSVSWEYLKFLVEENRTDDAGRKLYEVWTRTGRCPPEVMATAARAVAP